ncbi:MAG: DUF342 domain-containing protein [Oscillospiraceae bacterium]|nr:DUF342 domain-containing protein [Oscillospiraceae bacterium]
MAFNKFFSRLFGGSRDEDEIEELEDESEGQTPQAEPEDDLSDTVLTLSQEHPLFRLWSFRKGHTGWMPPPLLQLSGPPDRPRLLSGEELTKELSRLRTAIDGAASSRAAQLPRTPDDPCPNVDARAAVFMTRDQLAAWLFVYPPIGEGQELSKEMVSKAISDSGIQYGLDETLPDSLPEKPDRYFHLFPLAQGTAAIHGKDGSVVDLFARKIEREVTVDEFNQVDYSSLNLVQNVEEGAVICRIILPTEGVPGKTVQGKEIPARNGRPAAVPQGRNTEVSEDGTKLVATRSGHVEFTGRAFMVKPLLDIPGDVDFSVGSINFLGDVHVHGDICSGFTVRATGNITVDGVVEASTVEAGGDLVVAKGVLGNNQAVVTAHQTVYAKYLENCRVHARESLQTDCIVNCDVYSDGTVQVRSGRGTIIGGCVRAATEVNASIVGSRSERPTMVILGGQPCEDFEKELLQQELREMSDELDKVSRQPDSPAKLSRLSTLRMKIAVDQKKLEQFDKEDAQLLTLPPEEIYDMRLNGGIVYPGTEIRIGMAKLKVKQENRQCTARLVDGQVCIL